MILPQVKLPLLPQDKANHFFYGALTYAAVSLVFGAYIGLAVVLISGVAKEIYDKISKTGTFDVYDAVATTAGGLICFIGTLNGV